MKISLFCEVIHNFILMDSLDRKIKKWEFYCDIWKSLAFAFYGFAITFTIASFQIHEDAIEWGFIGFTILTLICFGMYARGILAIRRILNQKKH